MSDDVKKGDQSAEKPTEKPPNETTPAEPAKTHDGGIEVELDGKRFVCFPKTAHSDPTKRGYTDDDGNEYFCIPYEDWHQDAFGRRYGSKGRLDPDQID